METISKRRNNLKKLVELRRETRERIEQQYIKLVEMGMIPYSIAKIVGKKNERYIYHLDERLVQE